MIKRLFWPAAILCAFAFSGCTADSVESGFPERRPLGSEFEAYQPMTEVSSRADAPSLAESEGVITLRQALAFALIHNPQLKAFSWQVRAAEARQLQASLMPNPEFEVEVEEVAGSGARSGFDAAETTIFLSQLIELSGKRSKRTELASLERRLAGWDYESKRLDVLTEVSKAFVEVLAEQERVGLAEDVVRLSREVLSTVSQRVEAGKDSPVEQTKGEVALANAEIELEKARSNLESARKRLSATWGGGSAVFEKVAGDLNSTMPIPTLDQVMRSVDRNPDMARWATEVEQRQAALKLAKANTIQDLRFGGGMQSFNETDDNAVVFGISIPLPLFDRNQGNILEAQHKLAAGKAQREAMTASIHTAVTQAHAELSSALREATALREKVLEGARSAFEAAGEGYRSGKLGFLEVLDAQRTLFEAKARYIDALAVYHSAKADVERLIGRRIDAAGAS
ncbi:MAG TPA: TolC family protein [Sedimentisphaerales bacterium]|nr:TolC family protein [Sedimentisphaerales bacterium]